MKNESNFVRTKNKKSTVPSYIWYISLIVLSIALISSIVVIMNKNKSHIEIPSDISANFKVVLNPVNNSFILNSLELIGEWNPKRDFNNIYIGCDGKYLRLYDLLCDLNKWLFLTPEGIYQLKGPVYIEEQGTLKRFYGLNCFKPGAMWELYYANPEEGGVLLDKTYLQVVPPDRNPYDFSLLAQTNCSSYLLQNINRPPYFTKIVINNTAIDLNNPYFESYEQTTLNTIAYAQDPNNDTLYYNLSVIGANITIKKLTSNSFSIQLPDVEKDTIAYLKYSVTDGEYSDNIAVKLLIKAKNDPPVITNITTSSYPLYDNSSYDFYIEAYDPNGDNLTYSLTCNDPNVSILHLSGNKFLVTFPNYHYNTTVTFNAEVSDGQYNDSYSKSFLVINGENKAPIIQYINWSNATLYDKHTYNVSIIAYDPDGDPLAYSFISYDSNVSVKELSPGEYQVTFPNYKNDTNYVEFLAQVKDTSNAVDLRDETVAVKNSDKPPVIEGVNWSSYPLYGGNTYIMTVNAYDPNGGPLTIKVVSNEISNITQISSNQFEITFPLTYDNQVYTFYIYVNNSDYTVNYTDVENVKSNIIGEIYDIVYLPYNLVTYSRLGGYSKYCFNNYCYLELSTYSSKEVLLKFDNTSKNISLGYYFSYRSNRLINQISGDDQGNIYFIFYSPSISYSTSHDYNHFFVSDTNFKILNTPFSYYDNTTNYNVRGLTTYFDKNILFGAGIVRIGSSYYPIFFLWDLVNNKILNAVYVSPNFYNEGGGPTSRYAPMRIIKDGYYFYILYGAHYPSNDFPSFVFKVYVDPLTYNINVENYIRIDLAFQSVYYTLENLIDLGPYIVYVGSYPEGPNSEMVVLDKNNMNYVTSLVWNNNNFCTYSYFTDIAPFNYNGTNYYLLTGTCRLSSSRVFVFLTLDSNFKVINEKIQNSSCTRLSAESILSQDFNNFYILLGSRNNRYYILKIKKPFLLNNTDAYILSMNCDINNINFPIEYDTVTVTQITDYTTTPYSFSYYTFSEVPFNKIYLNNSIYSYIIYK